MADTLTKPLNITTIDTLRRIIGEPQLVSSRNITRNVNQTDCGTEDSSPPSTFLPKSRCSSTTSTSNISGLSLLSPRTSHKLILPQTVQIVPPKSPSRKFLSTSYIPYTPYSSPHVVRKRCAVCCMKYQYDENNNNGNMNNTITRSFTKY